MVLLFFAGICLPASAAPTFTSVSPTSGITAGGTAVIITGSGFTNATAVTFGGAAATSFTVVSDTSITATTPAGAAGSANIIITAPAGTATGTYTYTASAPTFTSISPTSGTTAGGTAVTIIGTGFTGATAVTFGSTVATSLTVVSDTEITTITPAGTAGSASIVITTPAGTATGTYTYTAVTATNAPAPAFTSISPASGTFAGGTAVTITGTGFTGATAVTIGGNAATSLTVVSDTSITVTTPAHASAGTADVIIVTPGGSVTGSGAFTYTAPAPAFTSISPVSGTTAGGTAVTITGTGFTGATAVTIGGTAATSLTIVSDTSITATTPAGTAGSASIVITAPGGTATGTGAFTYTATTTIPTVTSVSPTYGPVSTSTAITITGTGFTGATAVTIGGNAATSLTVVSDTEITATTPASSTIGQVDVLVTTASGTSSSVTGDKYNFAAAATTVPLPIFSASPTSGAEPLEVTFTDESTGSPGSWSWDFGDGNTSTLENPTNTYVTDGTYSVMLTETNSLGTNTTTETGYIVVGAAAPVASFSATPTEGSAPLTVQFSDTSTNTPISWVWNFGDGSSSSVQDPVHTYSTPGDYTVTLIATNAAGSNVATETDLVSVTAAQAVTPLAPTYAVTAAATTGSSVDSWLAQQNAEVATASPTKKSPGYDVISALIGCGVVAVAGIALRRH